MTPISLRRALLAVVLAVFALGPAAASAQVTLRVDPAAAPGGDGLTWATAFPGIKSAVNAAIANPAVTEIWVRQGTYFPGTTPYTLRNGLTMYGGFAGNETSRDQRNPTVNVTTLTGQDTRRIINGGVLDSTAVIDGFTVTGGNANGAANDDRGGGILCTIGAGPTVRRCLFIANRCTFGGGAGYLNSSSPTFTDCTFDSNQGGSYGGAFDMANSVGATFDRCVFRNNRAARAGGIEIFGSSPVKVYNSLFVANQCTGAGGGGAIYVSSSAAQIRNCTVIGNSATATASGGLLVSGGSPTVTNCIFAANTGTAGITVGAQVSAGVAVTYTMMPFAYAGAGNINATPTFATCGVPPYRLAPGSPGIDAGNNAGLPAGTLLDLGGSPRFVDVPSVANTGAGSAPIVDMGCFEADVDCNGNGVPDACDVASGTSLDLNGNRVPDECECQGGVTPTTYCASKLNSLFCTPTIGFSGYASASNNSAFVITAASIINQKSGLLFYGYASAATPFLGGTLCVRAPVVRTPVRSSAGSTGTSDCSGVLAIDLAPFLDGALGPGLATGAGVQGQWWYRDPQASFTVGLSDALEFLILP